MAGAKRGPKPTLRKAKRVSVMLEGSQVQGIAKLAKRDGLTVSQAHRLALARGLAITFQPAAFDAGRKAGDALANIARSAPVAECVRRAIGRK